METKQVQTTKNHASRGQIGNMIEWVLGFVILAVVLVVGFTILANLQTQQTSGSYGYNATNQTQYAMAQFPTWFSTIVTVIAASIVLGIVITGLYVVVRNVQGRM